MSGYDNLDAYIVVKAAHIVKFVDSDDPLDTGSFRYMTEHHGQLVELTTDMLETLIESARPAISKRALADAVMHMRATAPWRNKLPNRYLAISVGSKVIDLEADLDSP